MKFTGELSRFTNMSLTCRYQHVTLCREKITSKTTLGVILDGLDNSWCMLIGFVGDGDR